MKNILIVDGMNMFIRSFVVVPTMDTNGYSIGGITGFLKSVKNLVKECSSDLVIIAWDGEGGSRRRRGIFEDYKAGRKIRLNRQEDMETQDESFVNMSTQMTKLKNLISLLGMIQVEAPEVEADDVIGMLCTLVFPDDRKVIVTSDRDMLQLVNSNTLVYSPTKKMYWGTNEIKENIGVLAENYIFVKSLMGDKSDNIPGVGGIGEKTAVKLFPFLAERQTSAEEIRQHAEQNKMTGAKYKAVLDNWERFLENIKLMQLSSPIISAQAARRVRISATEQKPRFVFTEFKLQLVRYGIQSVDIDTIPVFQGYKLRSEKLNVHT